ncbi:MAG TPA: FGGY-family carbohydrate kinase [Acidimicrobiia bacterium]|nr:FGGY-family carbohydrate kinase [Acidimicrobiia bacterium]
MTSERVLVVDVGTSSVRAAVVDTRARLVGEHREPLLPSSPTPGLVEFDPAVMAEVVLTVARAALERHGPVAAVGVANQRGSAVLWDRASGVPVGPGIGWQDLRTVGRCLELQAEGIRVAPNHSATKLEWLLSQTERGRDLCFGTVDAWVAWTLSSGALHVTDASNAALTGLRTRDDDDWSEPTLAALQIPPAVLPTVVDSAGMVGEARALPGAPPIGGLLGDQQASLLGQGCVRPGDAKITFGTGAMLDIVVGPDRPRFDRGPAGTFPIVTRRVDGADTWGLEAIMLAAGANVEWLRDDLGLIPDAAASHDVASRCPDSGDVWFVPALLGIATPFWDYGARGTLLGLTRGTTAAHVVRAVLEGIAHTAADLVDATQRDAATTIPALRIDGGMSANPTFVQALADAAQLPVEIAPVREATALGAAFAAGLAVGIWPDDDAVAATWAPSERVLPAGRPDRERWRACVARARDWIPELSAIDL